MNGVKEGDWITYTNDGKVKETIKYISGVAQLTEGAATTPKKNNNNNKNKIKTPLVKPPVKSDTTKTGTKKDAPKEN